MSVSQQALVWQSSMSVALLQQRARLLGALREFFAARQVLEVEVPLLGTKSVTDPYIEAIRCDDGSKTYYLQTSPEYFMKRLLAGGAPSIYFLGKAFRRDEIGRNHNPEFTMLEWYRRGFNDQQLMGELSDLLSFLRPGVRVNKISYGALFYRHFECDPHVASAEQLALLAKQHMDVCLDGLDQADPNLWLDLLFSHVIEPNLREATIVFDYPSSQCALAKIACDNEGRMVAKRFELFWQGLELANAYWELSDSQVQRQRFEQDLSRRRQSGLPLPDIDEKFLAAMDAGLPECAGIALGVDRLFMCLEELPAISEALTFTDTQL